MRAIVAFVVVAFSCVPPCLAWSEGGHHLIAVMAFQELFPDEQAAVIDILKAHPQFDEKFRIPEKAGDPNEWLIGRAAYWPDIVIGTPFDRPNWHWQLALIRDYGKVKPPMRPGECPKDATLESKDLHIEQAIELCRRVFRDKSQPAGDRAIALCWLCHLVGDSHQPCHAGSVYVEGLFPDGDRGASAIPTKQLKSLHAFWDSLLGTDFDAEDLKRRATEIRLYASPSGLRLWDLSKRLHRDSLQAHSNRLEPARWLNESRGDGIRVVYQDEVHRWIQNTAGKETREPIDLQEAYIQRAEKTAKERAALASLRLAELLRRELRDGPG